jgi:hypothetical protein
MIIRRLLFLALVVGALATPVPGNAQLFLGNFGVSTAGLSPQSRAILNQILLGQLRQQALLAQQGRIALQQEIQRLSPILNCNAPAASSQVFAITACLSRR